MEALELSREPDLDMCRCSNLFGSQSSMVTLPACLPASLAEPTVGTKTGSMRRSPQFLRLQICVEPCYIIATTLQCFVHDGLVWSQAFQMPPDSV